MLNLRQLISFIGVYEEKSFSKAAARMNATQSGMSMQIRQLEESLGSPLFVRSSRGVEPTFAGQRLYNRAIGVVRQLDEIDHDIKALSSSVSGELKAGLMPTFTRAVLAPSLLNFMRDYPNVQVSVVEAYSASLTESVARGECDFAIVPRATKREGIRAHLLGSDREFLVRRPDPSIPHMAPLKLSELPPLKLVLPNQTNARRINFEKYASLHGIRIEQILSMDAMIATLEFVANSEYMTILPETICVSDISGTRRFLNPLSDPPLTVEYVVIQPSATAPSLAAKMFLDEIQAQFRIQKQYWQKLEHEG